MTPIPKRVCAVVGNPARHSRSPAIHNAAFAEVGLDWEFTSFELPVGSGAAALDAMRALDLAGLSATMPFKADVAAAADEVSDDVAALGVANCIVPLPNGRLRAENTDSVGFINALKSDANLSPEGIHAVILGGGGAARAVVWALGTNGAAKVTVINRSPENATTTATLAGSVGVTGTYDNISSADLIVNATPAGMGTDDSMPCAPDLISSSQVAIELIYEPLETPWLKVLRAQGVQAHNGLSMLVHQAAAAFELWTGIPAPVDTMKAAATS